MRRSRTAAGDRPPALARATLLALAGAGLGGCGQGEAPETQTVEPALSAPVTPPEPVPVAVVLPGDDDVLATVNGAPITRYELDAAARAMLGEAQARAVDARVRRRVLESLVTSRALAQHQAERMDEETLAEFDKRMAAYREQLLVNDYLNEAVTPAPITEAMIEDYHARHPEEFGARTVRSFEMLFAPPSPGAAGASRARLEAAHGELAGRRDWQAAAAELARDGLAIEYRTGRVDPRLLAPELHAAAVELDAGEVSAVVIANGRPHVLRVVAVQDLPPRPLGEVRAQVRERLVPVQLARAVEAAARDALAGAELSYPPGSPPGQEVRE